MSRFYTMILALCLALPLWAQKPPELMLQEVQLPSTQPCEQQVRRAAERVGFAIITQRDGYLRGVAGNLSFVAQCGLKSINMQQPDRATVTVTIALGGPAASQKALQAIWSRFHIALLQGPVVADQAIINPPPPPTPGRETSPTQERNPKTIPPTTLPPHPPQPGSVPTPQTPPSTTRGTTPPPKAPQPTAPQPVPQPTPPPVTTRPTPAEATSQPTGSRPPTPRIVNRSQPLAGLDHILQPQQVVKRGLFATYKAVTRTRQMHGNTYQLLMLQHPGKNGPTEVIFDLNRAYSRFSAHIGIDQSYNPGSPIKRGATVVYKIYLDDQLAFESDIITPQTPTVEIDLDISTAAQMKWVVSDAGDGISFDWAMWGDPQLHPKSN